MTLFTPETAGALNCSLLKISRIERGHVNDSKFLTKYRTWFKQQTPSQIAARQLYEHHSPRLGDGTEAVQGPGIAEVVGDTLPSLAWPKIMQLQ
ncbi:hypothetical protein [Cryobacterium sp. Y11]|uniref:hypothetical protein n=1 Tax=Cryobacterium sp. Y11 TaxID=2045016 RepID=UPI001E5AEE91|nr:hypothetical protein [Cryobacterium sp. Y11]